MGFSGSNIPGHSGTSQKHRKAFVKIKKFQQQSSGKNTGFVPNDKAIIQKRLDDNLRTNRIVRIVVLVAISLLFFTVYSISEIKIDNNLSFIKYPLLFDSHGYQLKHDEQVADVFTKHLWKGDFHYCNGELQKAQNEYVYAIRIYPQNIKAIIELMAVLNQRCLTESDYCSKVQEYQVYLKKLNQQ